MPVYLTVEITIKDQEVYAEYVEQVPAAGRVHHLPVRHRRRL